MLEVMRWKFLQLMGASADKLYLFPPNTHDQICITALAMEKAKSPMAVDWSKQIIAVGNGPGQETDDIVEALKLVRAGKPVNFQGAGMGQWINQSGKSVFVEYAKP
jgi:branched-chain amino acid transport system substrate-binding protein